MTAESRPTLFSSSKLVKWLRARRATNCMPWVSQVPMDSHNSRYTPEYCSLSRAH
jgi:hypothetical protein